MVYDKKASDKKYRENNKQKILEQNKIYRDNNKQKIAEQNKIYKQTENGKKSYRITRWKMSGILTDDYDFLYDWYMSITRCLNCGVELISGRGFATQKHLDHDHTTGEPCMVVCGYCNVKILK